VKAARLSFRVLVGVALVAPVTGYLLLRGSLPRLDGEIVVEGLDAEVTIERDALGIPTISGQSRRDVAFATGFVHAQDRFFQMDLLRRSASGELAALAGPAAVPKDVKRRFHRLRRVAREVVASANANDRAILEAYTHGVNIGLEALSVRPFEYLVSRVEPEPWKAEDTVLALYEMFFQLNDSMASREVVLGEMHDALPEPLYRFLLPMGTEWDAPLVGEPFATPPIPGPEVCDLRGGPVLAVRGRNPRRDELPRMSEGPGGSNNWAVAGTQTASGRAIVANDMHLTVHAPNIWYRLRLLVGSEFLPGHDLDVIGASLPGAPLVVVGSNRSVAWGFTNSRGDWADRVELELDPEDADWYRTPDGYEEFEVFEETILVKGRQSETLVVRTTRWGPVVGPDDRGRFYALRWLPYEPEAANFRLLDMEGARTVRDAVAVAQRSGVPPQNLVAADSGGSIAWTIAGKIPRKFGFDPGLPSSWAEEGVGWFGWLEPDEYPVVIDPPSRRIWTANARVVDSPFLGGSVRRFQLGARGKQIRDGLLDREKARIDDMLRIQFDDRALYLERWRELMLDVLSSDASQVDPLRAELRSIVEGWDGRATVEAVGYRLVREFRRYLLFDVLGVLVKGCGHEKLEPDFLVLHQSEGPLWRLVSERPEHLLNPRFSSWHEQLLAAADAAIESCNGTPLDECTWGDHNHVRIRHPLSGALPWLSRWLDLQNGPLPGDDHMPRVQRKNHGAAERFAVSPGDEESGYFHMPGGQSGHPCSPHYRDQHEAWVQGEPTSFMPGPAIHQLTLRARP
jgi:penicillin amidase